jgi:methylglutaconyl-CoA hydratase
VTHLDITREDGFARITLDRPRVRNAFNAEMIEEVRVAFGELASESPDALRGVVLAGAGDDVDWMRASRSLSVEQNEGDAARMQAMFTAVEECPVPVIARVQGAAVGGGMGLCAAADIVLATPVTTFGFTETKLGIIPAVISTFVVPKIGESHARALFMTGQRFDAERAQRIGLVHEILTDLPALDARVEALVAELRSAGPVAVREAKALVRELRTLDRDSARGHAVRRIAELRSSPEGQEGLAAFLEKRPPAWRDA